MPDGEWDLGASWSGELRRRMCSQEQTRRVRQTDVLRGLYHQDGTRAQPVWPSKSELVQFNCVVGELSLNVLEPASEIRILDNRLFESTNTNSTK